MATSHLVTARRKKDSNFYTMRETVESELSAYWPLLEGKSILCNCDDSCSAFAEVFKMVFSFRKIKKLVCIKYQHNGNQSRAWVKTQWWGGEEHPERWDDVNGVQLKEDGDFRSDESKQYLQECDVVVTNPPFHLSSEFVKLLMEYQKDFIIMGNPNKQTDKFVFMLLRDKRIFLGRNVHVSSQFYKIPIGEFDDRFDVTYEEVTTYPKISNVISWFTTFQIDRGLKLLECWRRYYDDPDFYEKYDNCDAIHIKKIKDIPCDYRGVMGVPVTFWERYDVSDFEVVGMCNVGMFDCTKKYTNVRKCRYGEVYSKAAEVNCLLAIKHRTPPEDGYYYIADNCDGYLTIPLMRILIRRKPKEVSV